MENDSQNSKKRIILGFVSLAVFSFLFIQITGGPDFTQYRHRIERFTETLLRSEEERVIETKVHQLVDEESAVIEVVESASPSVVSIVIKRVDFDFFSGPSLTEAGIGTGFIVDPNGIIVTNSHVVEDPNGEYSVILKDGITYEVSEIHLDRTSDLAILEITARGLPILDLADSDTLKVGQKAIAIGNALGRFQNTVTSGIVSGIEREIVASGGFGGRTSFFEEVIQTDAALNPGNSGGPLLDLSGRVIGINVATTPRADNIGFAIPSNTLRPILVSFLEEGRIIRPYLGVSYQIITEEISRLRELPQGAFISRVYNGSPADEAGLERGDIIVAFDGVDLDQRNTLARLINRTSVGDMVELRIDRDGEEFTTTATLSEVPENF